MMTSLTMTAGELFAILGEPFALYHAAALCLVVAGIWIAEHGSIDEGSQSQMHSTVAPVFTEFIGRNCNR